MQKNVFISYAGPDQDLVENFQSELKWHGINAWVYSIDKTLGAEAWKEIESKIHESKMVIFVISKHSTSAEGQKRELELALEKVKSAGGDGKIIPLFHDEVNPSECPVPFNQINGEFVSMESVKSTACKIVKQYFPDESQLEISRSWKYPLPGEWLSIRNLDRSLERSSFALGDKLYFRRISPMGLFECYSPKIKGLYWVSPENVVRSHDYDFDKSLDKDIPYDYTIIGMIHKESQS